eukprot:2801786-Karenia_brevis.AAC.1
MLVGVIALFAIGGVFCHAVHNVSAARASGTGAAEVIPSNAWHDLASVRSSLEIPLSDERYDMRDIRSTLRLPLKVLDGHVHTSSQDGNQDPYVHHMKHPGLTNVHSTM